MAEAWASSADACPSAVPIGAAAAVPWLAIPSEPDVKEVNTLPLKRKTVKTKAPARPAAAVRKLRSEEHTSELQSLMRISYAVFCLKKKHRPIETNITKYMINQTQQN